MTCCGTTRLSLGKSFGSAPGARIRPAVAPAASGRHRVVLRAPAAPDLARASGLNVGDEDGPGVGRVVEEYLLLVAERGASDERDLPSVGRPARVRVAVNRRREEVDRLRRGVVDGDEAVVAATARECDLLPVGRPVRRAA